MRAFKKVNLFVGFVPLILCLVVPLKRATAATFTVNSTSDANDSDTTDNVCDAGGGVCGLRAAIQQANATVGGDTINFSISGAGVHTLQPASALPTITGTVTIDGTSQPGYVWDTPLIDLDGTNAGNFSGLTFSAAPSSVVKGLIVRKFSKYGIELAFGGDGVAIQANFIGTNAAGTAANGNGLSGVRIDSSSNCVIGGTSNSQRNVISGNTIDGIFVFISTGCVIKGNFIGTDKTGTVDLGNGGQGIYDQGNNTTIGGGEAGAGNVISGNSATGIFLHASSNTVKGNLIGTDVNGTAPLKNDVCGISVDTANNTIGGTAAGEGNLVAFNGGTGVLLSPNAGAGISILGNSIYSNGSWGIDLSNNGVTANDDKDPDAGPNNLQNFPVLSTATSAGGTSMIKGTLNSNAGVNGYRIEFFSNDACDSSGNGEGKTFLGAITGVNTDGSGNASFTANLNVSVASGKKITATATSPANDTSEFSACITSTTPGAFQFSNNSYSVNETGGTATITVSRTGGSDGAASVDYATSDGTATAGSDYTAVSGTLNFANGETSKTFNVTILMDAALEGNETVDLVLNGPTEGSALGSPASASLTIADACGNGTVDTGEECDAAGSNSDTAQDACRSTCVSPSCGDDVNDSAEECDDGNNVDGDGCDGLCATESATSPVASDPADGTDSETPAGTTSPEDVPAPSASSGGCALIPGPVEITAQASAHFSLWRLE